MKAKLTKDMDVHPKRWKEGESPIRKEGTIIDDPDAHKLVQIGVAVPADEECEERAGMSKEKIEAARKHYDKIGIAQKDWAAFDQGLMIGYKSDGKPGDTWIPGPKWSEGAEESYYES